MAGRYDNAYSQLVAWLKIILPIAALALLSTLFLVANKMDGDGTLPYADVDVETLAREQRITAPTYSGVSDDGTAFALTADRAQPGLGDPTKLSAEGLRAELKFANGIDVEVRAKGGQIDTAAQRAALEGGVVIRSSNGYEIRTEGLAAHLDATRLTSDTPISADAPFGHIEAGRMELTRPAKNEGPFVLVFNERVKLVYDPPE